MEKIASGFVRSRFHLSATHDSSQIKKYRKLRCSCVNLHFCFKPLFSNSLPVKICKVLGYIDLKQMTILVYILWHLGCLILGLLEISSLYVVPGCILLVLSLDLKPSRKSSDSRTTSAGYHTNFPTEEKPWGLIKSMSRQHYLLNLFKRNFVVFETHFYFWHLADRSLIIYVLFPYVKALTVIKLNIVTFFFHMKLRSWASKALGPIFSFKVSELYRSHVCFMKYCWIQKHCYTKYWVPTIKGLAFIKHCR